MPLIEDEEITQASMDQLLTSNQLSYRLPSSLSVVVKRSGIKSYFDRTEYKGGQNAIITLNAGDQFIDGKNSHMCFELGFEGTGLVSARVGKGAGLCNIIERVVLTTESGVEVSRFENVNNYQSVDSRYRYSNDWLDAQGSTFAYPPERNRQGVVYSLTGDDNLVGLAGNDNKFCIPMPLISPLFNSNNLLPGMGLMSGLKIEISFTQDATAFTYDANTAGFRYIVRNAYILTDSYMLSDAVLGSLNEQSAQNSLEIVWEESTHVQGGVNVNDTNINQDSKLAVSRAQSVWTKLRYQGAVDVRNVDSFAAIPSSFETMQYRLAGLFFPNQTVDRTVEMYNMALQNWDHHRNPHYGCSVSRNHFETVFESGITPKVINPDLRNGQHIACTTLERSNVLSLSGLPIGSGRVLTLTGRLNEAPLATARVDMYIQYVKLCRVYIDRVVVKS